MSTWVDETSFVILSVDLEKYKPRVALVVNEIQRIGGKPLVNLFPGCRDCDLKASSANIFASHKQSLQSSIANNPSAKYHVVCEDDCFFSEDPVQVRAKVADAIAELEDTQWGVLLLGFVAMGPFKMYSRNVANVFSPWGAHCILYNGQYAQKMLSEASWQRDAFVEGWKDVPVWKRFGVYPCVAHQRELPRESPVKGSWRPYVDPINGAMLWAIPAIFIFLYFAILGSALIAIKRKKT